MPTVKNIGDDVVEKLLAEFNEELRCTGVPDFALLERCPPIYRQDLRSLMNVAALAYRALRSQEDGRRVPTKVAV